MKACGPAPVVEGIRTGTSRWPGTMPAACVQCVCRALPCPCSARASWVPMPHRSTCHDVVPAAAPCPSPVHACAAGGAWRPQGVVTVGFDVHLQDMPKLASLDGLQVRAPFGWLEVVAVTMFKHALHLGT